MLEISRVDRAAEKISSTPKVSFQFGECQLAQGATSLSIRRPGSCHTEGRGKHRTMQEREIRRAKSSLSHVGAQHSHRRARPRTHIHPSLRASATSRGGIDCPSRKSHPHKVQITASSTSSSSNTFTLTASRLISGRSCLINELRSSICFPLYPVHGSLQACRVPAG